MIQLLSLLGRLEAIIEDLEQRLAAAQQEIQRLTELNASLTAKDEKPEGENP